MHRRVIFRSILVGVAALCGSRGNAAESSQADRVVYHLCDRDKVEFVLACIGNHISAASGSAFQLALVVHGPALASFRRQFPFTAVEQGMGVAIRHGAKFYACANTLASDNLSLDDLLTGFEVTHRGGVAYLADLQAQGWAYLRP